MKKNLLFISLSLALSLPASASLTSGTDENVNDSQRLMLTTRDKNVALAAAQLSDVRASIQSYYMANNAFPASLSVLQSSGVYAGDFSTPYGPVQGGPTGSGFELYINVPDGGSQELIVKMIASRSNSVIASDGGSFLMSISTPSASALTQNLLSRVADPSKPNNNQMLQDLNINDFDIDNVDELDVNIINASTVNVADTLTTDDLVVNQNSTFTLGADFDGGANFNTNAGVNSLNISKSGSDGAEVLAVGVSDKSVNFTYLEDTSTEGSGNFGVVNFNLGGDLGEAIVTPLQITKNGLISLGSKVFTAGNDGSGSGLDADTIDGIDSAEIVRASSNNTLTGSNTFAGNTTFNGSTTFNKAAVFNAANTYTALNTFNAGITVKGLTSADGGIVVDGKWVVSADGNNLYEAGQALSGRYLGISDKSKDADKIDGIDSTQLARQDAANVFSEANTFNGGLVSSTEIYANGGVIVDGKWVVSADGKTLYENGESLGSTYLGINAKAKDADKIDGLDSSQLARTDVSETFGSSVTVQGATHANGGVLVDGKWVVSADGKTLYENGESLSAKYLGINAKAKDADKIDNLDSSQLARTDVAETFNSSVTIQGATHANGGLSIGSGKLINHNATASYDKIRLWSSSSYTMGMNSSQSYGWLNDYAMTFTMNAEADRGFLWRDSSDASSDGAMSLTTDGKLMVKSRLAFDNDQNTYISKGTNALRFNTSSGYVEMGSKNSGWVHFDTDRPGYYFSTKMHVNGEIAVYGSNTRLTASNIYENGQSLSTKYLAKNAKANDADKLDGINSTQFARTDIAETFGNNVTVNGRIYAKNGVHIQGDWLRVDGASGLYFNSYGGGWHMQDSSWIRAYNNKNILTGGIVRADGGLQVDGKWIASADGKTLYENGVALSSKYVAIGAKASDADKLDGINSTQFARTDVSETFGSSVTVQGATHANGGVLVDGKWVASADGKTLYENGQSLSAKYLGINAKAKDADKIDNLDSSQLARTDVAETFNSTVTINGATHANGGVIVDGKWVVSADGNTLYEGGVALASKYLAVGAKASDADKLDGINSTQFARTDIAETFGDNVTVNGRIYAKNGVHVQGDWLRVDGANGLYFNSYGGGWHMTDSTWIKAYGNKSVLTSGILRADGGLQVDGKWIASSNGNTLYEANQALSSRYLGINAKAKDADKLDGINGASFARRDASNTFTGNNSFTGTNTFSKTINANGGVIVDGKWVVSADGKTLYENGVALKDKYAAKGGSASFTTLLSSTSGVNCATKKQSGKSVWWTYHDISLSGHYTNYDELVFYTTDKESINKDFYSVETMKVSDYTKMKAIKSNVAADFGGFSGRFIATNKIETTVCGENTRIHYIYGVNT